MRVFVAAVVVFGLAAQGFAQCRWFQPWSWPRAAFESHVASCDNPVPAPVVAMDDFFCEHDAAFVRVDWWGVLYTQAQLGKRYYIAIYNEVDCSPGQRVYETCVTPRVRRTGLDCQQDRVFRFRAPIAFTAAANTRYWLQISEIEDESANPGQEDFRWSGRRPLRGCAALQRGPMGGRQPLPDACDDLPDDLSFGLRSKAMSGSLGGSPGQGGSIFELVLRDASTGEIAERAMVPVAEDGTFDHTPDVLDGTYEVEFHGAGAKVQRATVQLADGQDTLVTFGPLLLGDLTGDDGVGLDDLAILLSNYGL